MFITIHCGGLPFNGDTIKEKSLGGSESAAYYMAKSLSNEGHQVTIFTNHPEEGVFDNVRYVFAGQMTEQNPLGERFHYYAANTPCDILIVQRHPLAFQFQWASKINLLWMHDLAQKESKTDMIRSMHNIQGILTVSEYHKQQIADIYGFDPDIIYPITNGIDLKMYEETIAELPSIEIDSDRGSIKYLIYSSRPERGLENLVKPNGIMHQLWEKGRKDVHLLVCGYENTIPQMEAHYKQMWQACDVLPNVTNIGHLSKHELAAVQKAAFAHIYPTKFQEVSCITAMECMAAELPFIASEYAVLPETCADSGSTLIPLKDDEIDIDAFIYAVEGLCELSPDKYTDICEAQKKSAIKFDWDMASNRLMCVVDKIFKKPTDAAILKHLVRNSDIYAAQEFIAKTQEQNKDNSIYQRSKQEVESLYTFAFNDDFDNHYKNYYEYEKNRGVDYGPEEMRGNVRFETVASLLADLPAGSSVLDYGCAHGHYTINLAKMYPDLIFVGVDLAQSNVNIAKKWAKDDEITNVSFFNDDLTHGKVAGNGSFKAIIAAEVLEHVAEPGKLIDTLHGLLADDGELIMTTPYGPWEAIGYKQHHPWRAHLWHFERSDLHEMMGHFDGFRVSCAPSRATAKGDVLGSYITVVKRTPSAYTKSINMRRKLLEIMPRETVSLCMIVKDAEHDLGKCLNSVVGIVDEINICIDPSNTDNIDSVIGSFGESVNGLWPIVNVRKLSEPVLISGFDAARNESIKNANGDWIMWLDSDEFLSYPERVCKYLRSTMWQGLSVNQHHFAIEPLGVLKTDMPTRLFRNHRGVKFFGVVHEHPEIEMNKGVGYVWVLPDIDIAHGGYTNEAIRRDRFRRNIDLMKRDREINPDRLLGKFLWIRDLAQLAGYTISDNGGRLTPEIENMAKEGVSLWNDLLESGNIRMLVDGLDFYSRLAIILGGHYELSLKLDTSAIPGRANSDMVQTLTGTFLTKEALKLFADKVLNERIKDYE